MKTLDEFRVYYDNVLLKELTRLEKIRLENKRKTIIVTFIFGPIFVISLISACILYFLDKLNVNLNPNLYNNLGNIITVLLFPSLVGWILFYSHYRDKYSSKFRKNIVPKIIMFINDSFIYEPNKYISKKCFVESDVFKIVPDNYGGYEMFSGMINDINIQFSNVQASKTNGKNEIDIFEGVLFTAKFSNPFKSDLLILPDLAENLFGHIGTFFQSMNSTRPPLVKLEDPEFEKMFAVYSNDQIYSRYILTTSMMRRLINFRNKFNKDIYLSFKGSMLYIYVKYLDFNLDPNIDENLLEFDNIVKYYEYIELFMGILDDLKLNNNV